MLVVRHQRRDGWKFFLRNQSLQPSALWGIAQIFTIGGKSFTPPDISSFILKKLVDEARKSLGDEVSDAVITVPAYFNEEQKKDTKDAAERAGIKVLRLIAEPTAAAVAYALDRGKEPTILVYDLGGGTFDVSILRVTGNEFDVIAVDGDSCLGGDDFDQALVKYLAERIDTDTIGPSNKRRETATYCPAEIERGGRKGKNRALGAQGM